ncbi:CLUMA_CG005972, isoform A [Clunio marinus]|uniref:CLUMA_CG005972, isoform A n=1 Tax=Clunio marinus TaxID=568069 RepID=A0A1J1HWL9_9DIPT|nr:CLUMA_CG005972, isoform A [Clunio marinus]
MKGVYIILLFCLFELSASDKDTGITCLIKYLKDHGRLEEDFPLPQKPAHAQACDAVVRLVLPTIEREFLSKLSEKESIKSDCVSAQLKKGGLLDYLIKEEVIESSTDLSNQEVMKKLAETRETIKGILDNAAVFCNSDATYAGLFDKYLGLKNESLSALQSHYCMAKYVIDEEIIDVGNVNINPSNIDTAAANCDTVISNAKAEVEAQLRDKYKEQNLSQSKINCIMRSFRRNKMFENSIALGALENLEISLETKRENKERVENKMESFVTGVFGCFMG